jgi:hypothetical protein
LLAALLVAAVATRSAGLALVVAFGVALGLRSGLRAAVAIVLPAVSAAGAWALWSGARSAEIPEGTRDLLGPYGSWLADQTIAAPTAFLSGLPSHALGVVERVAAIFLPGLSGWPLLVAAVPLAAFACVGLVRLFGRCPPIAILFATYVGMLLLWPYLDRRLVVPIHPIVVTLVALGGLELLGRVGDKPARKVILAAAVAWVAGYSIATTARIADGWPTAAYRLRAEWLATAVEVLGRTAPADAVVGAPELWAALHLHGGWTVAPSVRFDPRRADPSAPMWGTPAEQLALWRATGIDHIVLEQAGALHGATLDALEERCPGTVFVLAQMPPLIIVRLQWSPTCEAALWPAGAPG